MRMTINWVVHLIHLRKGMPSRGTDKTEDSACANLTKFQKAKWKVLRLHTSATSAIESPGWRMNGLRAGRWRRMCGYCWMKSRTWAINVQLQGSKPVLSWGVKEVWPAGWWRWFSSSTLLSWDPSLSTASSLEVPSARKTWACYGRSKGSPK